MNREKKPFYILPIIILSQFAGTSLWFAGNAVLPELKLLLDLPPGAIGNITSAVQFGFISGTLTFAFLAIADRFSPSRVFFFSALLGAFFNMGIYLFAGGFVSLLVFRFLTGFFLAGIYPVGMKISADWYAKDLGKALGFLVGALVLGKAFPYFLKFSAGSYPWYTIIYATSAFAFFGGLLIILFVPDGPHRTRGSQFRPAAIVDIFRVKDFRSAAFGYFGHMWELYAFWAFVPVFLAAYQEYSAGVAMDIPLWSSLIIGMGMLGCIAGGYLSLWVGSARVAFGMMLTSGVACLFSPLSFFVPVWIFLPFLLIWGFAVVGDSAQFSTLVARTAPKEYVGSALTIVNCIGFSITIFSIELLNAAAFFWSKQSMYVLLTVGPVFGMWAISRLLRRGGEN
jgi:predicted MFS family arabinose efflux permease